MNSDKNYSDSEKQRETRDNVDLLTGEYKLARQLKGRHIAMIRYISFVQAFR